MCFSDVHPTDEVAVKDGKQAMIGPLLRPQLHHVIIRDAVMLIIKSNAFSFLDRPHKIVQCPFQPLRLY